MLKCAQKCLLFLHLTGAYHAPIGSWPDLLKSFPNRGGNKLVKLIQLIFKRSSSSQCKVKNYKDRAFIEDLANGERSPDFGNTVHVQNRPTECVLQIATER